MKQIAPAKTSTAKATQVRSNLGNHKARKAEGIVRADESFSIEAFCNRIGTTRSGILQMRRRGLIARMDGEKRVMILGSDYHDYLASQPTAVTASTGEPPLEQTGNRSTMAPQPRQPLGIIRADEAYAISLFEQLTGLGPEGRREAQRNGMPVKAVGKTRYVLGEDWIAYLRSLPAVPLENSRESM